MNFSTIEDSVIKEKKKFSNFLSRFLKNSRLLIILLIAAIITAIVLSMWIKNPEYHILYKNLSNEDRTAIMQELDRIKVPYKFSDLSGSLSIPKNKISEVQLDLSAHHLLQKGIIGFELLDKEKFGISQFNEQINYQRALEGELARTIQRINAIQNARIHIAFPKSSLFLEDKKKPSASVILELKTGCSLDSYQIHSILHLIANSVSNLDINNITMIDQSGRLLNRSSSNMNHIDDLQFQYSKNLEEYYSNRVKKILEPLFGFGNVNAQVTAQIDFNVQEKTQEKYSPNHNFNNQSIRSRQSSIHDQIKEKNVILPPSDHTVHNNKKSEENKNHKMHFLSNDKIQKNRFPLHSNINHENIVNYELNHSILHTKMHVGEIKRLSAAVVINFIPDKNGKLIPLSKQEINNIENLTREAIGYSKSRGDSVHVVNALFFQKISDKNMPIIFYKHDNQLLWLDILFSIVPGLFIIFGLFFLVKKYFCPVSQNYVLQEKKDNTRLKNTTIDDQYFHQNKNKNLNITDTLINQICTISNKNPRTIALIIRQWMSDKK